VAVKALEGLLSTTMETAANPTRTSMKSPVHFFPPALSNDSALPTVTL